MERETINTDSITRVCLHVADLMAHKGIRPLSADTNIKCPANWVVDGHIAFLAIRVTEMLDAKDFPAAHRLFNIMVGMLWTRGHMSFAELSTILLRPIAVPEGAGVKSPT
jgi:hypothetical protein